MPSLTELVRNTPSCLFSRHRYVPRRTLIPSLGVGSSISSTLPWTLDLAAENVAVAKSSVSGAASFLRLQVSKARSLVAYALRQVVVVLCVNRRSSSVHGAPVRRGFMGTFNLPSTSSSRIAAYRYLIPCRCLRIWGINVQWMFRFQTALHPRA